VLKNSLFFYKAQRSGVLPDKDVEWRGDSFINDGEKEGIDLSGGYFDAGDYMKFNFPQAAMLTVLAWGMAEFADGYKYGKSYNEGLATIKWGTDYLLKCHTGIVPDFLEFFYMVLRDKNT